MSIQYLLLARHGNTFAPSDKVVWVGANSDLPLVESGVKQAKNLAQTFLDSSIRPQAIYAGPLKRTSSYAHIVKDRLNLNASLEIDKRLHEIDYGQWSGLTDQEIKDRFGNNEFDQWQSQGKWPTSFVSSEKEIIAEVLSFVDQNVINQPDKKVILSITSNGRLKYFLKLIPNLWEQFTNSSQWKVSTGHVSLLAFAKSTWTVIGWNESPQTACAILQANFKASVGTP